MKKRIWLSMVLLLSFTLNAQQITININASQNKTKVSPYIYGRNNSDAGNADFYKEAGLRMARLNQGNNATKYNWRKKISSHPDWYNNVYARDWDATSQYYAANCSDMQIMWAFQLLGRVASNTENNFNDWNYNNSQWWQGTSQNLAGGGTPNEANPSGGALKEGDVSLYTEEWSSDETVELLNHWFGEQELGLNKEQFQYWNMDNEPDIWSGTHDDVMSNGQLPASEFMDKYIEVAKKAKAIYPGIKICGPVTTNEWQWYKWGDQNITINGKYYCWLEYFIKRCADEETQSGVRVLDVVDLHSYPYASSDEEALQFHRIYFDSDYVYPGANGVKTINGGWDTSQDKEYIFKRINDWLDTYFGENHGIKLGISEWGPSTYSSNAASVAYASLLGTFANEGVEYFTPWHWEIGMWETLHLFSRYSQEYSVSSISSNEDAVSAYTTVNNDSDAMTVIIVNRDVNSAKTVAVNLSNFTLNDGDYKTLQLAHLPSRETFVSHSSNALESGSIKVSANSFSISVPSLSTTAILLSSEGSLGVDGLMAVDKKLSVYPNPASAELFMEIPSENVQVAQLFINDQLGHQVLSKTETIDGSHKIKLDVQTLSNGVYILSVKCNEFFLSQKIVIKNRNR